MRVVHKPVIAVACVAALATAGCGGTRHLNLSYSLMKATVPSVSEESSYSGADLSYTGSGAGTIGAAYGEDAGSMLVVYGHYDLGMKFEKVFGLFGVGAAGAPNVLLSLKPTIGYWDWDQAPGESGVLLGIKTGLIIRLGTTHKTLLVEAGWLKLFNTADDEDTEVHTVSFGLGIGFG
ncbi:MAG: hypothetical protein JW909_08290 [Planctomycetes bacterium]|nr:hypothetical protein [Planctomycetota bacterium]